jgi:hypothetical protein
LSDDTISVSVAAGWIALIWYAFILGVCSLGYFQMYEDQPQLQFQFQFQFRADNP